MSNEKSRILVVDDEANNRKLIQQMLKQHYLLSFAVNGKEALEVCRKVRPDMMLLDIMMPEMDGVEVCCQLKEDNETSDIPVIFITAMNHVEDEVKGFHLGCVDYITKPISKPILLARINTQLTIAKQAKELAMMNRHLEKQNQKLSELQTLRDGLIHMIVHDMRSPIMAIIGNLELAEIDFQPDSTDDYNCIGEAKNGAVKLMDMVALLLDISKMEDGKMNLNISKVNLIDIVKQTIKMFDVIKKGRDIILVSAEETFMIAADSNMVQRVCQNFIDNAIKFTDDESGKIIVNIESVNGDKVRVSISDNGCGIPSEYHEKIFDKFFQVEARKQNKVHSSGLGMTFCKLAVEASGGRVGVESEVEKGSTFWFELPFK
ncbi:MAG: hybrid sensor histidine kinase/response regulator [Desulfamplus sp.]|nr:hybrid sensor histidine kinase/response regulator [Desulfamplus sp.]